MSDEISRRLTNAENGTNNIEFLVNETRRELNKKMESVEHNLALRNFVLSDIEEHVQ